MTRELNEQEKLARANVWREYSQTIIPMTSEKAMIFGAGFAAGLEYQDTELARLRAKNEQLRAALEPFAKAAEMWDRTKGSCSATDVVPLTMAPYRAAHAALAGGE